MISDKADSSSLETSNIAKEQMQKTGGKRPSSGKAPSKRKRSRQMESPAKPDVDTPRAQGSSGAVSAMVLEGFANIKTEPNGKGEKVLILE